VNPADRLTIVIAEDDDDDFFLTEQALIESRVVNPIHRVRDGQELLDYLQHRGAYDDPDAFPLAGLVILDLNMPGMDGRVALETIRATPELRRLPVVVLTTSRLDEDIVAAYEAGVNSVIRKPVRFEGLVEAFRVLGRYWFQIVELPTPKD
jgi:two-component system response regulator